MSIKIQGVTYYSPRETSDMLGISVGMLRYHRNEGNIEGIEMGTTTYYSEEQMKAADLSRKKTGPKGPRKSNDDEEQAGRDPSVMFERTSGIACLVGAAS